MNYLRISFFTILIVFVIITTLALCKVAGKDTNKPID